jgi:hypothetical protein
MRRSIQLTLLSASLLLTLAPPARSDAPFTISTTIQNGGAPVTGTESFSDIRAAFDFFKTANLQSSFASYNNNSGVSATISYLGTTVTLSLPQNGTPVTFSIPGAGLNQTFTGATRNDSISQLVTFLTGNGGTELNIIQHYLASSSPISPLAGNPNSLESSLSGSSFSSSGFNTGANGSPNSSEGARFSIGVSAGQFSSGGFTGQSYTVPISYAYRFSKSGWELQLNIPLTYEKISSGSSYAVQAGLGLQIPVLTGTDWYITPIVSAGAAASINFGAAGATYSYALGSRYTYHATPRLALTLGDLIGYVDSIGVKIDNYNINPKIGDTVTKNGALAEYETPWSIGGKPMSVRAGGAYTEYFGTKLFMNGYSDVFADFGTLTSVDARFYQRLRIGVRGTFGRDYSSVGVGLGYTF